MKFHSGDLVTHRLGGTKMIVIALVVDNPLSIICKFISNDGSFATTAFLKWEFEGTELPEESLMFQLPIQKPDNGVVKP